MVSRLTDINSNSRIKIKDEIEWWACDICHEPFPSKEKAQSCENEHITNDDIERMNNEDSIANYLNR